jgi:formylglycine-generating enzyme required for sulfatase activity
MDNAIRDERHTEFTWSRQDPSDHLVLVVRDYGTRAPGEEELVAGAVAKLRGYFTASEWEKKPKGEAARLGGQPALVLEFVGTAADQVAMIGECYIATHQGCAYWLFTWAPEKVKDAVAPEWQKLRQGFQLHLSPRPAPLDCRGRDGIRAAEVRRAQEAWARYLGRQVEEEVEVADGIKMTFVLIPPGKFRMGSPQDENEREPFGADEALHEVMLTVPFDLGKTEVTQAQYQALGLENPSRFKGNDLPVETVRWPEARDWAEKLTIKRGDKYVYRLPTEAEWEYACRGGRSSSRPFGVGDGRTLSSREANFDGNRPYGGAANGPDLESTCAVASYPANAFGLHDMHGNVWEWCHDWQGPYPGGAVTNPTGPSEGSVRVYRGGSWNSDARYCRAAFRDGLRPSSRTNILGFRLARAIR